MNHSQNKKEIEELLNKGKAPVFGIPLIVHEFERDNKRKFIKDPFRGG